MRDALFTLAAGLAAFALLLLFPAYLLLEYLERVTP